MKVLIVEDHSVVAEGLRLGLESEGHEVVTTDGSGDFPALVEGFGPDFVLLDLGLDGLSGLDLLGHLRDSRTVVLTGESEPTVLAKAYDEGAVAVLEKSVPFPQLLRTMDAIERGDLTEVEQRRHEIQGRRRTEEAARARRLAPFEELTLREQAVLEMLMEGHQAAEIADLSFVSVSTVRSQIRSILSKLGVSSQLTAVAKAQQAGWAREP